MANNRTADNGGGYRPPKSKAPLVAVGVVAAAVVIGLILAFVFARSSPSAAASSDPVAGNPAPEQTYYAGYGGGNGTLAALPPLPGNGGGLMYMLNGKVTAISSTSITLAGNGPSVTAAINSSTRVTGNVTSVRGIKVGDQVTAQVSGKSSSSLVATAIQDPGNGP